MNSTSMQGAHPRPRGQGARSSRSSTEGHALEPGPSPRGLRPSTNPALLTSFPLYNRDAGLSQWWLAGASQFLRWAKAKALAPLTMPPCARKGVVDLAVS
eukprot:1151406-Pelagomonas_calceolata.AAC.1